MKTINLSPQMWQTEEISELAKSLISFAEDFGKASLKKDAKNQYLKNSYITLDNLLNTVRPLLTKNKLAITQELAGEYLVTTLYHISGQFKGSAMIFNPMAGNKSTNNLQAIGGGITYAKRYALGAMLCISTDVDDDGNSAKNDTFTTQKKTDLPVGLYEHAAKAFIRDGSFKNVEKKYNISESAKKVILGNTAKFEIIEND